MRSELHTEIRNANMADAIHQPHDRLFRGIFAEPAETASFLRAYLTTELSQALDWSTLTLIDGHFIDEALRGRESDLLFEIAHVASDAWVFLYLERVAEFNRRSFCPRPFSSFVFFPLFRFRFRPISRLPTWSIPPNPA